MAPRFDPALNIPVANARSFLGNHSATVLMLAGNTPDSPKPKADLATIKLVKELPRACPMEARLQKTMDSAYPSRVPSRSMTRPTSNMPTA